MKVTITADGKTVVVDDGKGEPAGVASTLIKSDDARRFTLSVAYFADKPDVGKAADGYRDFAPASVVEDGAWGFMKSSREVGLWHADGTTGRGEVVESYIYRGPDWTPEHTECLIKSGDWLTGIIWDEATWPAVLEGKITGTSAQGQAARRTATAAGKAGLRKSVDDTTEPAVPADDEGLTEITKILADRIDGVVRPANGAPFLMMKHLEPAAEPPAPPVDPFELVAKAENVALLGEMVKKHRDFSMDERKSLAGKGQALDDGSYPIPDADALRRAAILARSGHGNVSAARSLIAKRAREMGVPNPLEKKAKMSKSATTPPPAGDTTPPEGYIPRDELDQLVKAAVVEATTSQEAELKTLREDMAKMMALPRSGGPVMAATGSGAPGSSSEAEDLLAKAAGYELRAQRIVDPVQRNGYIALAAEKRQQAAKLAAAP